MSGKKKNTNKVSSQREMGRVSRKTALNNAKLALRFNDIMMSN